MTKKPMTQPVKKKKLVRSLTEHEIRYLISNFVVNEEAFLTQYGRGAHRVNVQLYQQDGELGAEVFLYVPDPPEEKIQPEEPVCCSQCDSELEDGLVCPACGHDHREEASDGEG